MTASRHRGILRHRSVFSLATAIGTFGLLTNGLVSTPALAAGRPDLQVTTVTDSPGARAPGQHFTIKVTVRNGGRSRSPRTSTAFYLSKDARKSSGDVALIGRAVVPALAPGKRAAVAKAVTIPRTTPSALYRVIACADASHGVRETHEGNNCRAATPVLSRVLVSPPLPHPDPLDVSTTAEPDATASAYVVPGSASTITATGSDGTTFALAIPAHAVAHPITVSLTPIASIVDNPLSGGLGAAAELGPSGLQLLEPATLRITPGDPSILTPPAGEQLDGFAFSGAGREFRLFPDLGSLPGASVPDGQMWFAVQHFSGTGFGLGTAADETSVEGHIPVAPEPTFEAAMATIVNGVKRGDIPQQELGPRLGDALVEDYLFHVIPALNAGLAANAEPGDGEAAKDVFLHWAHWVAILGYEGGTNAKYKITYGALLAAGDDAIAEMLSKFFNQAYQRCIKHVQPKRQYLLMWGFARSASVLGDPDDILGKGWQRSIKDCEDNFPTTWEGTITYTWHIDAPTPCGGTCIADSQTGTGTVHAAFEPGGSATGWTLSAGNVNVSYVRSSTDLGTDGVCQHTSTTAWTYSGASTSDHMMLNNQPSNAFVYFDFSGFPTVPTHTVFTTNCPHEGGYEDTSPMGQQLAPLVWCPEYPRHNPDGSTDGTSGWIRGTRNSVGGQQVLDFTCTDSYDRGTGTSLRHWSVQTSGVFTKPS
ncbi:MAG TPA: CARDB domain-containing protein [Nocardioidaceae bacterium]